MIINDPCKVKERDPLVRSEEEDVEQGQQGGQGDKEEETHVGEDGQGLQPPGHGHVDGGKLDSHDSLGIRTLALLQRLPKVIG